MILITTYYKSSNDKRQKEIEECLLRNINNKHISKIYLLNDQIYEEYNKENKIVQIVVDEENKKRLTYKYTISFINEKLKDEKCIIANSDIYFDETLEHLVNYDLSNKFLALSRYDKGVLYDTLSSQDTWIFTSPASVPLEDCNFHFGVPGCDNKILYIFQKSGYKISNPSRTIKTHHLHESNFRTYKGSDRVSGPYAYSSPSFLS
jgi:hypothetical protein